VENVFCIIFETHEVIKKFCAHEQFLQKAPGVEIRVTMRSTSNK